MQLSILVLTACLTLCSAVQHYQLLEPWATLPEEPAPVLAPEHGQQDVATSYGLLLGRMRPRRSLQPGAPQFPQPGAGGAPGGQPDNNVDVSVTRERGVGTVVDAQGRTNVWRSNDGNTRVDAHGQWTRVYDGPARGQRSHNAGVVFSHRWR